MNTTAIINKIKSYQDIIIHRHVRPDPDAYGSQNGLAEIIRASFPEKNVFVVGEEEEWLKYFASMDSIDDDLFENALVIVCDTANQERVSDQRFQNGKEIIKIDHHPNNDAYGDLLWIDTAASSTSEMIYILYQQEKDQGLVLTDKGASLLYAGIVGDTGRFLYPSTSNRTFQIASKLIEYNFDRTDMYQHMYKTSLKMARLKGYILQNVEVSAAGVSHIKLSKGILEKFDVTPNETSAIVGVIGDIEGMKAWAIFVEEEDVIRVRLRSNGPIINILAAKYEGGGHPLASGAKIHTWDAVDDLLEDLEQICREE
ncbi:bifunctional oligoribonuclease/PAP phosphatase NrnA [Gracilibacillus oryzae]|uniref:Bifunctional oligoribonuclease/PAP phosphatase NrnA n=2 Tax=Gracilibacillus oryzae TaxID=1672701 RepID=A0A7C8GUJ7_9BACI|nr:bifunctional oligoribonuclease/PAP phosphatase NrnA [Gracilibacillus oryzae]KAB8138283.1 bifunctional oligoribonuclease/PAP phosphatase NrnA [Gracilibacillus oryzae]